MQFHETQRKLKDNAPGDERHDTEQKIPSFENRPSRQRIHNSSYQLFEKRLCERRSIDATNWNIRANSRDDEQCQDNPDIRREIPEKKSPKFHRHTAGRPNADVFVDRLLLLLLICTPCCYYFCHLLVDCGVIAAALFIALFIALCSCTTKPKGESCAHQKQNEMMPSTTRGGSRNQTSHQITISFL